MTQWRQPTPPRIALVTAGFDFGGGVPTVARWLRDCLRSVAGYTVDVHDLATSSRDPHSRRLVVPRSWLRSTLRNASGEEDGVFRWGANAVEIEAMRYRPRRELRNALQGYDLIQVVGGVPAWGSAVIGTGIPTVLLVATTVVWERPWQLAERTGPSRILREIMTLLTARIERKALRKVDVVVVLNSSMLEHVRSTVQGSVIKAPPGIDTAFFAPPAAGWRPGGYLLSVCRLNDPRKGLDRMIQAYSKMLQLDRSVPPLVLAGKGQLPATLLGRLTNLGLSSRVSVQSDVGHTELPELYRGASVFLQRSYEEGLGMSVLEAMACGLPVVSTDSAGARETVVHGLTGWLVPQADDSQVATSIADRVLQVLRTDAGEMGRRARQHCEKTFSSEIALRPFTDVYQRLLAGRKVDNNRHISRPTRRP